MDFGRLLLPDQLAEVVAMSPVQYVGHAQEQRVRRADVVARPQATQRLWSTGTDCGGLWRAAQQVVQQRCEATVQQGVREQHLGQVAHVVLVPARNPVCVEGRLDGREEGPGGTAASLHGLDVCEIQKTLRWHAYWGWCGQRGRSPSRLNRLDEGGDVGPTLSISSRIRRLLAEHALESFDVLARNRSRWGLTRGR